MSKERELKKIAKKICLCRRCCLGYQRKRAVPGEGPVNAKLMFLGESPGKTENRLGRPFVGKSGKFLDSLFKEFGIKRKKVFITSVLKCHPPANRKPKRDELEACRIWWQTQLEVIKPKLVVLLGEVATKEVLGQKVKGKRQKFGKVRGKIIKLGKIKYFVTYHPAAGRRFPRIAEIMREDFKRIKSKV